MKGFWCNGKKGLCKKAGLSNSEEDLMSVSCHGCPSIDGEGGEVKDIPDNEIAFLIKEGFNVDL